MSTVYTVNKHNLHLELYVTSCKSHEGLCHFKGLVKSNAKMFYDLTMIGDADCSVFILQLAKRKVCYLQSTLFTKTCAKEQLKLKM